MSVQPPVLDALQTYREQARPAVATGVLRFAPWLGWLGRLFGPFSLLICGGLVWNGLGPDFGAALAGSLSQISPAGWGLGAFWAIISLYAVGYYDAALHRAAATGVAPARARRAGRYAIAVAQAVGFGTVSAGLVRWRCLPELSPAVVARLSVWVSLSFIASWAVITALTFITLMTPVLLLSAALIGGAVLLRLRGRRLPGLPEWSARIALVMLAWTLVDTFAATMILAAFLPAGAVPPFASLYLAYLMALGVGLLSQSPGGVGAFELALIAALPEVGAAPLMAAALAYRIVYHVLPAVIATALLVRPTAFPAPPLLAEATGAGLQRALTRAPAADWGLVHQGAQVLLSRDQATGWLVRRTGGTLCSMARPLGPADPRAFADVARKDGLRPLLYKCDCRTATRARGAGWPVVTIARDAIIDTDAFRLDRPALRQLRRKLRAAAGAGLRIVTCPDTLPLADMQAVNDDWTIAHGKERGFSMGRFTPDLVQRERVVLGYVGKRLMGFITFHAGPTPDNDINWTLDLMRHGPDMPSGTMQALVVAGLAAARAEGVRQVSLAACPRPPQFTGLPGRIMACLLPDMAGLVQFKQGFAPRWQPLYATAPGPLSLLLGLAEVTWAIHRPPPLPPTDFAFETDTASCDAKRDILSCA
jgi:phosphatidylglycerol lysyltransferase